MEDRGSKSAQSRSIADESDSALMTRSRSSTIDPQSSPTRMWRSLDELAQTPEFTEMMHREFPESASEWTDPASRRTFLKLMGASIALAGVGGRVKPTTEQ